MQFYLGTATKNFTRSQFHEKNVILDHSTEFLCGTRRYHVDFVQHPIIRYGQMSPIEGSPFWNGLSVVSLISGFSKDDMKRSNFELSSVY